MQLDDQPGPLLRKLLEREALRNERTRLRRAAEAAMPPTQDGKQRELDALGPYIPGEPQARSRRRAALQRALKQPHGGLPESEDRAALELATLGPYRRGEPRYVTTRRATLKRLLPPVSTRGTFASPDPLPRSEEQAQRQLSGLGAYVLGESSYITRRRAAILRAFPDLRPFVARMALEALGPATEDEPEVIQRRRRALARDANRAL